MVGFDSAKSHRKNWGLVERARPHHTSYYFNAESRGNGALYIVDRYRMVGTHYVPM